MLVGLLYVKREGFSICPIAITRTHTYALNSKARACLLVLLYVYYKGYYISPLHICSDVRTLLRRILHISVQQTCVFIKIYLHLYWVTRCMLRAGVLCNTTIYLFTRYTLFGWCVCSSSGLLNTCVFIILYDITAVEECSLRKKDIYNETHTM